MWLAFVLGLLMGSFLNVCIARIPAAESIVYPPSHCPRCGRHLTALELVPVLSFFWLRRRCRGCASEISWRYPAIELGTAVVFLLLYSQFGLIDFVMQAVFYSVMIVIFFIDFDHQIIPNRLVLVLLALAVGAQIFRPVLPWPQVLWGGLLGGGFFFFLAVVSRGGMGGGDVKLMAVLGLWFGWIHLLPMMFIAFFLGGLVGGILLLLGIKKRKDGIAFGPFLVLSAFIVSMWGERLLNWYMRISGL